MGVNKLNSLMKEVTETAVISVKTNYVRGKHQFKNYMHDNDVPPNQIVHNNWP